MDIDGQIELDCIGALAGAAEVRNRILSGLALGYPSIESSTYMIKCRVKEHESLVRKVKDKRKNGKMDYSAKDVTDIIGLRLLALYRRDIPVLVKRFLSFIESGQKDGFSLFSGSKFRDSCTEIIIYTSSPGYDEVEKLVIDEFRGQGLSISDNGKVEKENKSLSDVRVVRKKSQYSSIHLIVWCRNNISKQSKHRIPMEVQIRTSLEDVWGEIDHSIRYKSSIISDNRAAAESIESAYEHLGALKSLLDGCARSADAIADQMRRASPVGQLSTAQTSALSVNLGTLSELSVPEKSTKALVMAVESLKVAFSELEKGEFSRDTTEIFRLARIFSSCADSFQSIRNDVEQEFFENTDSKTESIYYLIMESALCCYWAGRILSIVDKDNLEKEKNMEPLSFFKKSLQLYSDVGAVIGYFEDAILAYRIANVLSAMGDHELALTKFEEATRYLNFHEQPNLGKYHFLRVRIPRQYGIAIWESAQRIWYKADDVGMPDFMLELRQELYCKAIAVTLPLLDVKVEYEGEPPYFYAPAGGSERVVTANNILDYSLCYLRARGDKQTLEALGVTLARRDEFVAAISCNGNLAKVDAPFMLDTLRAAKIELYGDIDGARQAALRLIQLLSTNRAHWNLSFGERFVDEMISDAEATLELEH